MITGHKETRIEYDIDCKTEKRMKEFMNRFNTFYLNKLPSNERLRFLSGDLKESFIYADVEDTVATISFNKKKMTLSQRNGIPTRSKQSILNVVSPFKLTETFCQGIDTYTLITTKNGDYSHEIISPYGETIKKPEPGSNYVNAIIPHQLTAREVMTRNPKIKTIETKVAIDFEIKDKK